MRIPPATPTFSDSMAPVMAMPTGSENAAQSSDTP